VGRNRNRICDSRHCSGPGCPHYTTPHTALHTTVCTGHCITGGLAEYKDMKLFIPRGRPAATGTEATNKPTLTGKILLLQELHSKPCVWSAVHGGVWSRRVWSCGISVINNVATKQLSHCCNVPCWEQDAMHFPGLNEMSINSHHHEARIAVTLIKDRLSPPLPPPGTVQERRVITYFEVF
jgi:hypothetical protein